MKLIPMVEDWGKKSSQYTFLTNLLPVLESITKTQRCDHSEKETPHCREQRQN